MVQVLSFPLSIQHSEYGCGGNIGTLQQEITMLKEVVKYIIHSSIIFFREVPHSVIVAVLNLNSLVLSSMPIAIW